MSESLGEMGLTVNWKTRICYSVGHVMNDVCASMWFTYLLVYFHYVLEFDPTQAGLVLLIGQIADALSTPFVGYFSDKNDNLPICYFGRRKSWHIFGTFCTLATFPFIFEKCINCSHSDNWAQIVYYSGFVIIFQFGWASVQISHLSLIPELTPGEYERTQLTSFRYSFTVFSNVLIYLITWWSFGVSGAGDDGRLGPNSALQFRRVVWGGLSVGIVANMIFYWGVKETPTQFQEDDSQSIRSPLQRTIRSVFRDFNMYLITCAYMATRLFVNISQIVLPLYLHETLRLNAQSLAILPLVVYISSFLMSLILHHLNQFCGRKLTFLLGVLFGLTACVWIQFNNGRESFINYEIYLVALLLGLSGSTLLVTSLGLTADFIGGDTNSGAFIYGVMSFFDKLSNGVAVIVIQRLHSTTFLDFTYYSYVLSYVCGASAILGIVALLFINMDSLNRAVISTNDKHDNSINNDDNVQLIT